MIAEALPLSATRFTFILGVLVGMKLYEARHITTGSIVVPGFIAAYIIAPSTILVTGLNAMATQVIMTRVFDRFVLLYGRQRFVTTSAVAVLLGLFSTAILTPLTSGFLPPVVGIGYVVPALIAHDVNRAGARRTLGAVVFAGAVTTLPALTLGATIGADQVFTRADDLGLRELNDGWLPIMVVIVTLVVPVAIDRRRLRTGGFIGAVYVALWSGHPLQLLYVFSSALMTYGLVGLLKKVTILFGRRKFASMLVLGGLLSWANLTILVSLLGLERLPMAALPLAPLFIPSLLANDMERGSIRAVLQGTSLVGGFSFSLITLIVGLVDLEPIPLWTFPLLVGTGAYLFQERIYQGFSWLIGDPVEPVARVELLHDN